MIYPTDPEDVKAIKKSYMEDNVYFYKMTRACIIGFVAFSAILATCNHMESRVRAQSPGYKYHEVTVRLDDDNGQKDSTVIKSYANQQ